MIKLLIRRFIKNNKDTTKPAVREQYSTLSGVLGIIINSLLFIGKLVIGLAMNSIAIISDAFNNLSDTSSAVITIIGVKMANKKPDKEHPFGHGRIEYISSLIMASIIIVVGLELGKSSLVKIFNPSQVKTSFLVLLFLIISVLLKLWMFSYNRYMGKEINSKILQAASLDSLNDVFATLVIIISIGVSKYFSINIDGYIGALVSLLIIKSGLDITKEVVNLLIGPAPDKALVENLKDMLLKEEAVQGVHDLIIHEYGPGKFIGSVHAEVLDTTNIIDIHEKIDNLEMQIKEELGVEIVIHMDPISSNQERIGELYQLAIKEANKISDSFEISNFRITEAGKRVTLIFDIIPLKSSKDKGKFISKFKKRLEQVNPDFYCIIN